MSATDRIVLPTRLAMPGPGSPDGAAGDVVLRSVEIHDPVDPAAYSTWVWAVGLALLVAVAAWYAWGLWSTRRRPATDPTAEEGYWDPLRVTTLAEVDTLEQRFRDGEEDLRGVALDLNRIMRTFSTARLGRDTTALTVSEIAELDGTAHLADALRGYEEPAFAYDSDAEALAATTRARQVIGAW